MEEFNQEQLAEFFSTTVGMVRTNFPKLRQRVLKQGYFINKRGKGDTAVYEVERVAPQDVDKSELSTAPKKEHWNADLPGERWTTCY